MGGGIAIDFAVAHPEATEALIPVDSRLNGWQPDSEFAAYLSAVRTRAGEAGIQAARDAWIYSAMFKPALENQTVASRLVQIIADYSGWHWVHDNPLRTPDPPAAQRLHTIRVPTLIVIGEQDVPDCRQSRKPYISASPMRARW
jgi:pimeloyl-ACP methyl ester carboxylesterase